jgi:hypothetical protein
VDQAATVAIAGAPVASTSMTITESLSLFSRDGDVRWDAAGGSRRHILGVQASEGHWRIDWRDGPSGADTTKATLDYDSGDTTLEFNSPVGGVDFLWTTPSGTILKMTNSFALAFFGAAAAVKQTVTGSRGGNAALASLLTKLSTYGLITDSSTA